MRPWTAGRSPRREADAGIRFTVGQSVDMLLKVFTQLHPASDREFRNLEELILAPSAELPRHPAWEAR